MGLLSCWSVLCLLLLVGLGESSRPVTNEDIRDAILSVVHMIRSTEDKLERHEYRERALGDQIKKALSTIDKRQKLMEPIKGTLGRLDERLATVETILMQKEERQQKTTDTLEDIQKKIPDLLENLKKDILDKLNTPSKTTDGIDKSDLDTLKKDVSKKIDEASKGTLKELQNQLSKIKEDTQGQKKIHDNVSENLALVKNHLSNSSQILKKYENKLAEYNNRLDPIPDKTKGQEVQLLQAMEVQKSNIEQILSDITTVASKIQKFPDTADFHGFKNDTLRSLEEVKDETARQSDRTVSMLDEKLKDLKIVAVNQHEDLNKSVGELMEFTDTLNGNIANSYEQLKESIQGLGKLEQVMVQTADGVLDTKRRVEYGVHQILLEIGELIKGQNKEINTAIADRFDLFEMSILDEETGALANLTSKIGQEIDQVWRQIGIMHQQMMATADTLNKLQNQTDSYVNGSLNTMDNMHGKVGQITSRMSEVDDNLNYLLGRLSLVTQEFNQIKIGLGTALDEIKGSFQAVQKKIEDKGPGPHKIPPGDEKNDISN